MASNLPQADSRTTLQAALGYADLGWPVLPGAVWHDGRFADPANENPVANPCLRPLGVATTDAHLVREWWSAPGLHMPNVFTVTGSALGAFMVAEPLVTALADDPRFGARPTPVLAFPNLPLAYFLVRPPMPSVLLSDAARVVGTGMPLPLPPSALETMPVIWLITPDEAGDTLMPGDALADLIQAHERDAA
ncbi:MULTISPECIES: bifunctional DNA primase/polymerase [Saccharothrix]|uniref:bifunctional DNA primase/polymerase n=1 Tax=Saccharothrix TaxID=2071 RepID=UPI00093AA1C6|nr:bifunctional DNA primase/polymerase [Saccharothrix sp. CB00851]OKI27894.1 hypothetical protein A6A25_31510 [Saccharothrix sp. CB00851]